MNRRGFFRLPLLGVLGIGPKSLPTPSIPAEKAVALPTLVDSGLKKGEIYVSMVCYPMPHTSVGLQPSAGEIVIPEEDDDE